MCMEHKRYTQECTICPPKLFLIIKNDESNEMDGNVARTRRWSCEKFQHNSVSKRLVKKIGEEGLYLYLKRQSRWHLDEVPSVQIHRAKCSKSLMRGVHHLGFGRETRSNWCRWKFRGWLGIQAKRCERPWDYAKEGERTHVLIF